MTHNSLRLYSKKTLSGSLFEQLIVFLFLSVSGNPAFVMLDSIIAKLLYIMLFVFVLFVWGKRIPTKSYHAANHITAILILLFILQYIVLGHITVLGSLNTIVKFYMAICIVGFLGARFKTIMLKVMCIISIISIPLYLLNLLGVHFPGIIPVTHYGDSIIIYYQLGENYYGQVRNCGMFWEPGAFAGYIIVTLSLFINDLTVLWKEYKKQTVVLAFALITTLSTTGFICFLFLLVSFLLTKTKNKFYAIFVMGMLLMPVSYFAFTRLSFIGGKINEQLISASESGVGEVNVGRIGTLLFDWHYIKKHPLIGNGLDAVTRYADHIEISDKLNGLGNGFSGIVGDLGILFVLLYFYIIYKNKSLSYSSLLIIEIVLMLQGECFLRYPLFMALPFINYTLFIRKDENSRSYYLPQ